MLTGLEFNKLVKKNNWTLVKYLESNDLSVPLIGHNKFKYVIGEVLNDIYFTHSTSGYWYKQHCFLVEIPEDAQVSFEKFESFKADKVILVKEVDEEYYKDHIEQYIFWLKNIKNQTEEVCLRAVKRSGLALEYIIDPTEEMCLIAVKDFPCAIKYVKNQTDELCEIALEGNPNTAWLIRKNFEKN